MKQFILKEAPDAEGLVRLRGEDYHYLARVRRLRRGSRFEALLPDGERAELTVVSATNGVLTGQCRIISEQHSNSAEEPFSIILFQGLPRFSKMDLIVRQAAESGIKTIVPFISEYSSVKKSGMNEKTERWKKIIKEARQQSGSGIQTEIEETTALDSVFDYWNKLRAEEPRTKGIFFHQKTLAEGSFHEYLYSNPRLVVLAVGPEGGFSPDEADRFTAEGFSPLVIGNTILRSETAALYGAAAIRIILLESSLWTLKN